MWANRKQTEPVTQGVSFFFKQWGGVHKKLNGRELGGQR